MRRLRYICDLSLALLLCLLALTLLFGGCRDKDAGSAASDPAASADGKSKQGEKTPRRERKPDPAPTEGATIVYTGNWRGFQVPCGCDDQQYGGWPRTGTALSELSAMFGGKPADAAMLAKIGTPPTDVAQQPMWIIDCGNFAWRDTYFPELRARTHLLLLEYVGARASVPGSEELRLPRDAAVFALGDSPVPLVSANLKAGPPEIEVLPVLELAKGWYLTGLSTWAPSVTMPPADAWWELTDPVAAIKEVVADLPADAKLIVVAQHQTSELIREAAQMPQVISILGFDIGPSTPLPDEWARIYPPPVSRGKNLYLVSYDLRGEAPRQHYWEIFLGVDWKDDQDALGLVQVEREQITAQLNEQHGGEGESWKDIDWGQNEKYLPAKELADKQKQMRLKQTAQDGYIGPASCTECHAAAEDIWHASLHSHAIDVLKEKGEDQTLDCLRCHVTGLLEPGGYNPVQPVAELAAVSCENCHGPGAKHVSQMKGEMEVEADMGIVRSDLDSCLRCHDEYNSPRFERDSYWAKIKH